MIRRVDAMEDHDLIGLDRAGALCSCGVRSWSQLEHLADVACEALEVSRESQRDRRVRMARARLAVAS